MSDTEFNKPFEGDPIIEGTVVGVMRALHLTTFIETGTYLGSTSGRMAELGFNVKTVENHPEHFATATSRFGHLHNWRGWKAHSAEWLHSIVTPATEAFFYLDAHWEQDWPLLEELKAVSKARRGVIAIHDFEVPGKEFGFDTYDGNALSMDYIQPTLDSHFRSPVVWHNEQALGAGQGVCYLAFDHGA